MPKYMVKVSYQADGVRGLLKEGGTKRSSVVRQLIEGQGGSVEAFYFAYGEHDAYLIVDFPKAASALGVSLAVNASGAIRISTVPLITPAELDEATKTAVTYRVPGA